MVPALALALAAASAAATARVPTGAVELMVSTLKNDASPEDAARGVFRFSSKTLQGCCDVRAWTLANVREEGPDSYVGDIVSPEEFRRRLERGPRGVLFFVHGFNVQPGGLVSSAQRLQAQLDSRLAGTGAEVNVLPVCWPCGDKRGLIRDYKDDQHTARDTARLLASLFDLDGHVTPEEATVLTALRRKSVSMLSHSMGNRVVRLMGKHLGPEGLWAQDAVEDPAATIAEAAPKGLAAVAGLLDHLFLVAADVPADSMAEDEAVNSGLATLAVLASRLHVLHAADDVALLASLALNWQPRLGARGPSGPVWRKMGRQVSTLDCNGFNGRTDRVLGHGYHSEDEAVDYYCQHIAASTPRPVPSTAGGVAPVGVSGAAAAA